MASRKDWLSKLADAAARALDEALIATLNSTD